MRNLFFEALVLLSKDCTNLLNELCNEHAIKYTCGVKYVKKIRKLNNYINGP